MNVQDTSTSGQASGAMTGLTGFSEDQNAQMHAQLAAQLPFSNWGGMPTPNGLINFYHNSLLHAAPWNGLTPGQKNDPEASIANYYQPSSETAYRNNPELISDCGTSLPGDSGYGSRPPQSGGLPSRVCDDFPEVERFRNIHLGSQTLEVPGRVPAPPSRSRDNPDVKKFHCERPGCTTFCKTRSELKKHEQRHAKPYRCEVPACKRTDGFSTKNDRQRHERTVHRIKSGDFQPLYCYFPPCSESPSPKAWPRADNFRQHLARVHHVNKPAEEDLAAFLVPPNMQPNVQFHQNDYFTDPANLTGIGAFESIDNIPRPKILPDPVLMQSKERKPTQDLRAPSADAHPGQGKYNEAMGHVVGYRHDDALALTDLYCHKVEQDLPGLERPTMMDQPTNHLSTPIHGSQSDQHQHPGSREGNEIAEVKQAFAPQRHARTELSRKEFQTAQDVDLDASSSADDSDDPDSPDSISLEQSAPAPRPELQQMVDVLSDLAASKRQPQSDATSIAKELKKLLPPEVLTSTIQALLGDSIPPSKEASGTRNKYPNGQQKRLMSSWVFLEDGSRQGSPVREVQETAIDAEKQPGVQSKTVRNRSLKRKNEAINDPRPRKQSQMEMGQPRRVWRCCQCVESPLNTKLNGSCTDCEHPECPNCVTERFQINEEQRKKGQDSLVFEL
ncbi:hypothetical protein LIA77_09482 [Sarocladium implicatum]|nr:hypothetical protein LIA77_09482 [Sarocladium implicatum]